MSFVWLEQWRLFSNKASMPPSRAAFSTNRLSPKDPQPPLPKQSSTNQIKSALDEIFDSIVYAVAKGERVEIRNFGVFSAKKISPRKFVNPKTKEVSYLSETTTLHFKPSKNLMSKI